MRSFRLQCTLRVLLLGAMLLGALYLALLAQAYVATGVLGLLAAYQLVALVRYVEQTNRELARFLRSIRYTDFSQRFTGRERGTSFDELGGAFTGVMDKFRRARAEKEAQHRYLHTVMQHVGVGLISFKEDGTVGLINNAAKRLLGVPHLRRVQDLAYRRQDLAERLLTLASGESVLVKLVEGDQLLQLSIYATAFKLQGEHYRLVSIQNIGRELEEKEVEAWQKLTRVLTHEIMNSITPIASLAATANELLAEDFAGDGALEDGQAEDAEAVHDVREAMRTIERRSQSLLGFVGAYRQLTRIPRPNFKRVPVRELFDDVAHLLRPQIEAQGVELRCSVRPETLTLTADPDLIEQVLINLVKNAAEAVADCEAGVVEMEANVGVEGRPVVQVIDNGTGIVEEALDKIFIPFFTTKKDGSGIGLSLSREIMRQHGGTISAVSTPGERTAFTLRF